MELNDKLDQKYNSDKKSYEKISKLKEHVKKANHQIKQLTRAKEDAEINKRRAIEDKDKAAEENADAAIKIAEQEIEKLKANVNKMKEILKKSMEKVDSYIEELSKDPEFSAHINSIIEKRYNRKLKKYNKEKEQVDLMINLVKNHPTLENNLKGMIRATERVKELDDELKSLDPVKDKKRIDEINNIELPTAMSKKSSNEKMFMDFCIKNNVEIDKDFLDKLVEEQQFSHNKNDDIRVARTLKNISKGYDKRIAVYEKAIEKIPGAKIYEENVQKHEPTQYSEERNSNNLDAEDKHPAKKFKWWEFRKRFRDWKERRNVKKIEKDNSGRTRESSEKFRDSYKYDIVKDYVDKKEEKIFKEALNDAKHTDRDEER